MKRRVLLSIHPEYANAILDGRKGFEFRRVIFKEKVTEVFIYATAPVSQVVGRFKIEEIFEDAPSELWAKTKNLAGVTREKFDSYFINKSRAFAIKVCDPVRFLQPQPLSKYLPSNSPPQSFCYI